MRKTMVLAASAAALFAVQAAPALAGNCRDPWITQAIKEVTGREPNGAGETGECTYTQYGGGSWSSYAQLKGFVTNKFRPAIDYGNSFAAKSAQVRVARTSATAFRNIPGKGDFFFYNGKWYQLVGQDGSTLIGNDSGGLVNAGGLN